MSKEIMMVVDAVSNEKGVDKEVIFDALEAALASATRKKHGEECKVTIRKARHEAIDMLAEIKDSGGASEDEVERAKKKVEEVVSEGVKGVDVLVAAKEKDILDI